MDYIKFLENNSEILINQNDLLKIVLNPKKIEDWKNQQRDILKKNGQPLSRAEIGIIEDDPYFLLLRDLIEFPDGQMRGYCRLINQAYLMGGKGVAILPEFQGKILLLHQFRHPTRQWHYEIPRGFGEPGISSEENAHKEIKEEVDGEIKKIIDLGSFYNNTGFEGNLISLFYVQLSSVGKPELNEGIESYKWLTIKELESWIANGIVTDGFTIAAYVKAKLRGLV